MKVVWKFAQSSSHPTSNNRKVVHKPINNILVVKPAVNNLSDVSSRKYNSIVVIWLEGSIVRAHKL
ncbi:hypothetical protein TUM4445_15580 [Shewanella sp. MBTL60-112-B2]|nr:hypothetical protein TUM4444_17600 [Shewanella sp. MBTL60-112-B1]GIU31261.1 hypothetical protein TUM4445_15580 [Shewanella sp. MBTL60-112-B2]